MNEMNTIVDAQKVFKQPHLNTLLVPVDFSEHSAAALVFAARTANCLGASLLVLHVVHDPGEMPGYYEKVFKKKVDLIQDAAEVMFEKFMNAVAKDNPELGIIAEAEKTLVKGLPVRRTLEVIEKVQPKMVFVGSHGHTGLKRMLLGSKAEQLVHLSPVPITVIKQNGKRFSKN